MPALTPADATILPRVDTAEGESVVSVEHIGEEAENGNGG